MFLSNPHLITMLYTMATILYGLFGMFVFNSYNHSKTRMLFMRICAALALWSFGYGASISASTLSISENMYQLGNIGFVCVFAMVLHFIVHITESPSKPTKIYWLILLYTPTLLSLVMFGLPFLLDGYGYRIVQSSWGWVPVSTTSYYNLIFIAYYIGYTFVSMLLVFRWKRHKQGQAKTHNVQFALVSLLMVVITATIVKLFSSSIFGQFSHNIGPILGILPTFAVLQVMDRNGTLNFYGQASSTIMLRSGAKDMLIKHISTAFIIGGISSFLLEYFFVQIEFFTAASFGFTIIFYGYILKRTITSSISDHTIDNNLCMTVSLFIPFLSFYIMDSNGTSWPATILFIVAFMLYNNTRMIIGVSYANVISIIMVGIIVPSNQVTINPDDYLVRLVILGLFIAFAVAINLFYIAKLKENQQHLSSQEIISKVSSTMVTASLKDFDALIDQSLALIGDHYNVDRVYYFIIDQEHQHMTYSHGWSASGVDDMIGSISNVPITCFAWWMDQLRTVGHINIPNIQDIPDCAYDERNELIRQGVVSTFAAPMYINSEMAGFIGIGYAAETNQWDLKQMDTLKIIGNVLSDARGRNTAEAKVYSMAYKDHLTGLPNRAAFFDSLEGALSHLSRTDSGLLVGLMDLDGFKAINDNYGHDIGDRVLIEVGRRLNTGTRGSDMVCRMGGDEFVQYFTDIKNKSDADYVASEILNKFTQPIVIDAISHRVTISLGIVWCDNPNITIQSLLADADKAMYVAKKNGKNCHCISEAS